MIAWASVPEDPVHKVWTLLFLNTIKPWRLMEQALKAVMNIIKPWRLILDWLGWLEAKKNAKVTTKMPAPVAQNGREHTAWESLTQGGERHMAPESLIQDGRT